MCIYSCLIYASIFTQDNYLFTFIYCSFICVGLRVCMPQGVGVVVSEDNLHKDKLSPPFLRP